MRDGKSWWELMLRCMLRYNIDDVIKKKYFLSSSLKTWSLLMHLKFLSCTTSWSISLITWMSLLLWDIHHACIQGTIWPHSAPSWDPKNYSKRTENLENNSSFFVRLSYEDLRMVDPDRAGLHPFMVAASENPSDLSAVNCLLRRDPSLAYGGERIDHSKSRKRKRQREETVIKIEQEG